MKFKIISEDHPRGLEVDWPAVPSTGDMIAFRHRGRTNALRVERVEWEVEGDTHLDGITVYLTY